MPSLRDTAGKRLWVKTILNQNKDKNFVQRLQHPEDSPKVTNADHTKSTVRMGNAEVDGGAIAFPTLIQPTKSKKLVGLSGKAAAKYAVKTKQAIRFNSSKQAQTFAESVHDSESEKY